MFEREWHKYNKENKRNIISNDYLAKEKHVYSMCVCAQIKNMCDVKISIKSHTYQQNRSKCHTTLIKQILLAFR